MGDAMTDYRTMAEYCADEAHRKRRAHLNGEPEPVRGKPDWRSRCSYCGELEVEPWRSCCGERHFEEMPECPLCEGEVDSIDDTAHGIETTYWQCNNCDWRSDPE